ncbi:spindle and kinetochore-associated protein 1-like [Anopheles bellator]|uniref:spindle and kinetochore-associated protein 1-like n=1 Tax=Anopheles bellator TaxID=139047 RepID=UPI002648DF38|nr:spindle and kinetochore-associated protein 1-like [Anopheles bellator]
MDKVQQIFEKQIETMMRLELFLDIHICKKFVMQDLNQLQSEAQAAADRVHWMKEYMETDRGEMVSQYADVIRKMRRNELLMLHLLEVGEPVHSKIETAETPAKHRAPLKEKNTDMPSKMYLLDYSKSPFVSRTKTKKIEFHDFECDITESQFETIPKYLRGRMQLVELKQFLATEVIKCFEEKYSLMYKTRKAIVNPHDLAIWKEYNVLQTNFPDQKFITQEDIARRTGKTLDKKSYTKLQMLRHLHILQEARSNGVVYFLWVSQANGAF